MHTLCEALINDAAAGTRESWLSWRALLKLPLPGRLRDSAERAARSHSADHALLARAALDLRFVAQDILVNDPGVLLDVVKLRNLPERPPERDSTGFDARFAGVDEALVSTQVAAAEAMLGRVGAATALVVERGLDAPRNLAERLIESLGERGFEAEAAAVRDALGRRIGVSEQPLLLDADAYEDTRVVRMLAEAEPTRLSRAQATRLDALADFLETLKLTDLGAVHLLREPDGVLRKLTEVGVALYGFDSSMLAAQARVLLKRIEIWGGNAPCYGLTGDASGRTEPEWAAVDQPEEAVVLLLHLLTLGRAQAAFAARSLWDAPVAHLAAPWLRAALPSMAVSPEHQRLAAYTLGSFGQGPEPDCWVDSDDPVLRAVAANLIEPFAGTLLRDDFRRLLDDPDGWVRISALERIASTSFPDVDAILAEAASQPRPGWTCLHCRTVNPPASSSGCRKDGCHYLGAEPSRTAGALLNSTDRQLQPLPDRIFRGLLMLKLTA
ncbi:hypothetical protein [Dactylosporangium cerinum]